MTDERIYPYHDPKPGPEYIRLVEPYATGWVHKDSSHARRFNEWVEQMTPVWEARSKQREAKAARRKKADRWYARAAFVWVYVVPIVLLILYLLGLIPRWLYEWGGL